MVLLNSQLTKTKLLDVPTIDVLGDGQILEATHQGQAIILPNVRLSIVLYVLGLKKNMFPISMASTVREAQVIIENVLI